MSFKIFLLACCIVALLSAAVLASPESDARAAVALASARIPSITPVSPAAPAAPALATKAAPVCSSNCTCGCIETGFCDCASQGTTAQRFLRYANPETGISSCCPPEGCAIPTAVQTVWHPVPLAPVTPYHPVNVVPWRVSSPTSIPTSFALPVSAPMPPPVFRSSVVVPTRSYAAPVFTAPALRCSSCPGGRCR